VAINGLPGTFTRKVASRSLSPLSPQPAKFARIRVALVDDDPHFRLFLESMLGASGRHEVVAVAGSAEEAMAWPTTAAPHVALVDVGLPGRTGSLLAGDLLARFPGALIIMVSALRDDGPILEAIRGGAVGYVLKGADAAELVAAIDDALAGGAPMSPAIARRVLALMRAEPAAATSTAELARLTPRETEMLELVATGAGDKEVAEKLGVARPTVKNCLLGIYAKWRVSSRTEAAVKFVRAGGGSK
jgi:DNA-binding NarL/FixJ family response regulator